MVLANIADVSRGLAACVAVLALNPGAVAWAQAPTTEHSASLTQLFRAEETAALARTLPADRAVHFRVRLPVSAEASGVLVFVSPGESGELPAHWTSIIDEKRLLWIAADGYGNSQPTAERMLVAVMALRLAQQMHAIDGKRQYVAGMSGGGRIASQVLSHFPQHFTGGMFMVGADFYMPRDANPRALMASRRLVFVTGSRDFNQREMRRVRSRYAAAGVSGILFLDEPGFGHELATTRQLTAGLDFLDGR